MLDYNDFDIGWIVGYIESSGSFTTNIIKIKRKTEQKTHYYTYRNPAFFLVNKDRNILEKIRDFLEIGKINRHGDYYHLDSRRKTAVIKLASFLNGRIQSQQKAKKCEKWMKKVREWRLREWGAGADNPEDKNRR